MDRDWRTLLVAGGFPGGDALSYALGYREAADVLVEQVKQGHRYEALIYPIFYCYRHSIELLLKVALTEIIGEDGRRSPKLKHLLHKLNDTHNLEDLGRRLREAYQTLKTEWAPEVWEALMWLHSIDTNAQTFRYARDRRGTPSFPEEVTYDVDDLERRMTNVIQDLLGTIDWIDDLNMGVPSDDYYENWS